MAARTTSPPPAPAETAADPSRNQRRQHASTKRKSNAATSGKNQQAGRRLDAHLAAGESPDLLVSDVARQAERCEVALDLITCTPTGATMS